MVCPLAQVEEVFVTEHGAVYQCSRNNCYWLEFQGKTTAFKISDFLMFKKRIDAIDIDAMLVESSRAYDFEVVMPYRTDRCFVLDVQDILRLQEILAGAKFVIQLNGEVNKCLRRSVLMHN